MKFAFFSHGITKEAALKLAELVGKPPEECKILYITTPANVYPPNPSWLMETMEQLRGYKFQLERFDIEEAYKEGTDIKEKLSGFDIVYVSGGNTFYFIYWAYKTGLKEMISEFLSREGVYAGESAGVDSQFEDLTPIAKLEDPGLAPKAIYKGFHHTDTVVIPHWENPKYYERLEKARKYYEDKGIETEVIKDGEAVFVEGERVVKV